MRITISTEVFAQLHLLSQELCEDNINDTIEELIREYKEQREYIHTVQTAGYV